MNDNDIQFYKDKIISLERQRNDFFIRMLDLHNTMRNSYDKNIIISSLQDRLQHYISLHRARTKNNELAENFIESLLKECEAALVKSKQINENIKTKNYKRDRAKMIIYVNNVLRKIRNARGK